MAQVTLYMDDETLGRVRAAAEAAGVSMSAWLVRLVQERSQTEWPPQVAQLAGAWRDLPLAEALRQGAAQDVPREAL